MPKVFCGFDVVLDDEGTVAELASQRPGGKRIRRVGPNGTRREFLNLRIVVGEVGHFRILRRRAYEGVATGQQGLSKSVVQLLGEYPASINCFAAITRWKVLEGEVNCPGRQRLLIEKEA